MKQTAVLALAAAAIFGMSAPAMADYVRIGAVEVGYHTDLDTAYSSFGGRVEALQLTADRSDISCRSVVVRYANGITDNVFSGRLHEDHPVIVDVMGRAQRIDSIRFVCRSDEFSGGKIYVGAEVGRYRDEWRRDPGWHGHWSGVFGWDVPGPAPIQVAPIHDEWIVLGRRSFDGQHDSEDIFAGDWRGRDVTRIGLRPLNADARCTSINVTFHDLSKRHLDASLTDFMRQGEVTILDLPGDFRNINGIYFTCTALGSYQVTIEVLARK